MKYWIKIKQWTSTSLLLRPLRLILIAYGYVRRGEKVEKPLNWSEI